MAKVCTSSSTSGSSSSVIIGSTGSTSCRSARATRRDSLTCRRPSRSSARPSRHQSRAVQVRTTIGIAAHVRCMNDRLVSYGCYSNVSICVCFPCDVTVLFAPCSQRPSHTSAQWGVAASRRERPQRSQPGYSTPAAWSLLIKVQL